MWRRRTPITTMVCAGHLTVFTLSKNKKEGPTMILINKLCMHGLTLPAAENINLLLLVYTVATRPDRRLHVLLSFFCRSTRMFPARISIQHPGP